MEGAGERAGLRKGDVVMEVNGERVEEDYLEDVITMIKDTGGPLTLLVVEPEEYERILQRRGSEDLTPNDVFN